MKLTPQEKRYVELLKVLRSHFGENQLGVVLSLVNLAPHAQKHSNRQLPRGAYFKGLLAGLSYDSMDVSYPECPYDRRALPNFAKGDNDPRQAWRDGSRDALRIRDIVLWPDRNIVPLLTHREFKVLPAELQAKHDAKLKAGAA